MRLFLDRAERPCVLMRVGRMTTNAGGSPRVADRDRCVL